MWVLGINWNWHDAAAALVDAEGMVWAFAEEERFTRTRHAPGHFPSHAAGYCLKVAGISWRDLDVVSVGWNMPKLMGWDSSRRDELFCSLFGESVTDGAGPELVYVDHHMAHALSAFHSSGYERAGVLVVDGAGEYESVSIFGADRGNGLELKRSWSRDYSLGAMYEAATQLLGFGTLNAGKTMGLAPYAFDLPVKVLPLARAFGDDPGAPSLKWRDDQLYGDFVESWGRYLGNEFGSVIAEPGNLHHDTIAIQIAASAQRTVEEAIRFLYAETVGLGGSANICMAGGVALNSVANGRLPEPLYIPPFPHDAGVAVGAAWSICPPVACQILPSPYLGTELEGGPVIDEARSAGYSVSTTDIDQLVDLLAAGAIGGIVEGRAEIGPRALGHRSLVALPAPAENLDRINRVKARERWRPLAPATSVDFFSRLWPDQGTRQHYMIGTTAVSSYARKIMPAAVHVDGTTRPQVVVPGRTPVLEGILDGLADGGLPPVLVNTSFNTRGEPIVDNARDAVRAFEAMQCDFLVLGEYLVTHRTGRPVGTKVG